MRAGQALAAQDGIVVEPLRHAAVGEYVREVQLSPGLEHAEYLLEELLLEGRRLITQLEMTTSTLSLGIADMSSM